MLASHVIRKKVLKPGRTGFLLLTPGQTVRSPDQAAGAAGAAGVAGGTGGIGVRYVGVRCVGAEPENTVSKQRRHVSPRLFAGHGFPRTGTGRDFNVLVMLTFARFSSSLRRKCTRCLLPPMILGSVRRPSS